MAKGARRTFNDPKKQLEQLRIAQMAKDHIKQIQAYEYKTKAEKPHFSWTTTTATESWKKGILTEITPRQGYGHIGVTYDEATGWNLETLKKIMNGIEQDHGQPKDEIKTDPTKDWAERWAKEHAS